MICRVTTNIRNTACGDVKESPTNLWEAAGKANDPGVRNPDGIGQTEESGKSFRRRALAIRDETKKAIRRPNADSCRGASSTLSTPPIPPPQSVHNNPPLSILILHIIALCSRLEQQFTVFWCSNLHFCWPQVQVITPLLLGCSRPSTSSVGTDAYRQKAILSTSYQAVTVSQKPPKHQTAKMTHLVSTISFSLTPRLLR